MGSMSVPCFRAKRQNPKFGGNTLSAGGGGVADLAWEWYSVPTVHCYNGAVLGRWNVFFLQFKVRGLRLLRFTLKRSTAVHLLSNPSLRAQRTLLTDSEYQSSFGFRLFPRKFMHVSTMLRCLV